MVYKCFRFYILIFFWCPVSTKDSNHSALKKVLRMLKEDILQKLQLSVCSWNSHCWSYLVSNKRVEKLICKIVLYYFRIKDVNKFHKSYIKIKLKNCWNIKCKPNTIWWCTSIKMDRPEVVYFLPDLTVTVADGLLIQ